SEYSQVPILGRLVIAAPCNAPASTSLTPASNCEIAVPAGLAASSATEVNAGEKAASSLGASLTGVTVIAALSDFPLKATVRPLTDRATGLRGPPARSVSATRTVGVGV